MLGPHLLRSSRACRSDCGAQASLDAATRRQSHTAGPCPDRRRSSVRRPARRHWPRDQSAASASTSHISGVSICGVTYSSWSCVPEAKNERTSFFHSCRSEPSFEASPSCACAIPCVIKRVERIKRAAAYDPLVLDHVAVGDPLLPLRARAEEAHVAAVAPDRIAAQQPEGRGPRAGSHVDEHVGPQAAQIVHQLARGSSMSPANSCAGARGRDALGDAVELEVVHVVLADHFRADFAEPLVVLGPGQREAAGVGLETLGLAILRAAPSGPLRSRPKATATRRRNCHASGPPPASGVKPRGKPAWNRHSVRLSSQPSSKTNESNFTAAFLDQLAPEQVDHVQALRFVHLPIAPGDVVPGVVVQEGLVGPRPLAFQVVEEGPAHLARRAPRRSHTFVGTLAPASAVAET